MNATRPARAHTTRSDPRWAVVVRRDARADGQFYFSVSTTGVYCRPSCAARRARPEHVRFHLSCAEAERAGFRACKRCRPDEAARDTRLAFKIAAACRLLESAESPPTLAQLAARASLSAWHFHRLFKRLTGLTPRQYGRAHRAQRLRQTLGDSESVTEALHAAGYSSSRFYAAAAEVLGMQPGAYHRGGANLTLRFALGQCSLGRVLVACSERGLCAILLGDNSDSLQQELNTRFSNAALVRDDAALTQQLAQVIQLVDDPGRDAQLPLDIRGTVFQQRVWRALQQIPAGQTLSYAELAQRIGNPGAVRAVAQACAANALAVAIPCHRVVRSDGNLSGYRWGIKRKQALLARERMK